jgi:hypothetical protein
MEVLKLSTKMKEITITKKRNMDFSKEFHQIENRYINDLFDVWNRAIYSELMDRSVNDDTLRGINMDWDEYPNDKKICIFQAYLDNIERLFSDGGYRWMENSILESVDEMIKAYRGF